MCSISNSVTLVFTGSNSGSNSRIVWETCIHITVHALHPLRNNAGHQQHALHTHDESLSAPARFPDWNATTIVQHVFSAAAAAFELLLPARLLLLPHHAANHTNDWVPLPAVASVCLFAAPCCHAAAPASVAVDLDYPSALSKMRAGGCWPGTAASCRW